MERIHFCINGEPHSVGTETSSDVTLLDYIRKTLELRGTKYMCREGGCGACVVAARRPGIPTTTAAVNSCLVSVTSCDNWEITTIEKVGNKLDGYHPLQTTLADYNGTQCGYCTPGWIMSMYSLIQSRTDLTMLELEKSLASNICRCTGYRPILDAFKKFTTDAPKPNKLPDIEDLHICKKKNKNCIIEPCDQSDWCIISDEHVKEVEIIETHLKDGKVWIRVKTIYCLMEVLKKVKNDTYMLVAGNTAKGVYPIFDYPHNLIDISEVSELKGCNLDQNLVIGAGTTITELLEIFKQMSNVEYFSYLKKFYDHIQLVAHIPVRNLGTIAGNLMIKYKHNEFPSDLFLLFETVGAQLTILNLLHQKLNVTMQQFLKLNMNGNIIMSVLLPPLSNEYKIETFKIMPRAQNAHAAVNAGFLYKLNNNNEVLESRIVYGALSPTFVRAMATEAYLLRKKLFTNETLQAAVKILEGELIVIEIPPEPSAEYRKMLALGLFYKGLLSICPPSIIHTRYRSGVERIRESRPVSDARQIFDTNPSLWPLNQPVQKVEALIQTSGEALYSEDIPSIPREVFAAFVLSTVSTGNIVHIDASTAFSLKGVIDIYSANDIPGVNSFTPGDVPPMNTANEEVLCSGEVKYYNQPISIVVAETQYLAEKAAKMVHVIYSNTKTPVLDVKKAMQDNNRVTTVSTINATDRGQDIEKVINGDNTIYGQYHFALETLVCVTKPTEEGLEVHSATQWMNGVQIVISKALKLQENKVDIHVRRLGGAYGIKITRSSQIAVACSLVTYKLNRPCRFILPITTAMKAVGKRLPCSNKYEVAVNRNGVIQYVNHNIYEDNGFMVNEPLSMFTIDIFYNCYNNARWNFRCYNVITDTPKNTWCRSPGTLEAIAMAESIMERISYELSLDPIEVRLANLSNTHEDLRGMVDTLKGNAQYTERRTAVDKFNLENRWKKRGLRWSLMRWTPQGAQYFDVTLSVYHYDGTISITHGGIEMGQGINTKSVQICAYLLKVPMDKIQIKANNTHIAPNGFISGGSLTSQNIGVGVQRCCQQLLERLQPVRNQLTNPTWEELIKRAFEMDIDLQVHGFVNSTDAQNFNIYGATLAEVEVDILTGETELIRVDLLQDVGRSVSPEIDIGQVEGAFIMGLGYWTCENLVYNENTGELLTDRTWHYKVPQARDIPRDFRIYFKKNSYSTDAMFGAKGVGEPPMCMSTVVIFAIREAIASARLEAGIPTNQWFQIDGPWTIEKVQLATATKTADFKFY